MPCTHTLPTLGLGLGCEVYSKVTPKQYVCVSRLPNIKCIIMSCPFFKWDEVIYKGIWKVLSWVYWATPFEIHSSIHPLLWRLIASLPRRSVIFKKMDSWTTLFEIHNPLCNILVQSITEDIHISCESGRLINLKLMLRVNGPTVNFTNGAAGILMHQPVCVSL